MKLDSPIPVGMMGFSPGNGHPFSFSAIINGFDAERFSVAEWPVIASYMGRRKPEEFGVGRFRVTHAWTQDQDITSRLCHACEIGTAVSRPEEMLGEVQAVIIARDDHESHAELALPFLEEGVSVFVDKPLALAAHDLVRLEPYLDSGLLMSCSAMRFAPVVTDLANRIEGLGAIRCVHGVTVNGWEKYGIHVLEAIFSLRLSEPRSVVPLSSNHEACAIEFEDDSLVIMNCLGSGPVIFRLSVYGDRGHETTDITDNFSMFRAMLDVFHEQVETGEPGIDPGETRKLMNVLRAGSRALNENRRVELDDVWS